MSDGDVLHTELRVVTSARWLAEDLASVGVLPVRHDLGIDLRSTSPTTAWWAPMHFAARMFATTGHNPFRAPGPRWTADLDRTWTGRTVVVTTAGALEAAAGCAPLLEHEPVHVKPAEVKVSSLTAHVVAHPGAARAAVADSRLHPDTPVQLSQVIDPVAEYRMFVLDGEVVAASAYLVDGVTWDGWGETDAPHAGEAQRFATDVLSDPRTTAGGPRAFVMDVARTGDGRWVVLEANPAWCSNPYHADRRGVVAAVLAAQGDGPAPWSIDPWLVRHARPLHVHEVAS